jgi:hypothetical protein
MTFHVLNHFSRRASPKTFVLGRMGIDPQPDLPTFEEPEEELPLFVEMRARAKCEAN